MKIYDIYGIGSTLESLVEIYSRNARKTGRTTMMLDLVKPGDVIVFKDSHECRRVERLLIQRGIENITCEVFNENDPLQYTVQGTCHFDHALIEYFYEKSIKNALFEINHIINARSKIPPSMRYEVEKQCERISWKYNL